MELRTGQLSRVSFQMESRLWPIRQAYLLWHTTGGGTEWVMCMEWVMCVYTCVYTDGVGDVYIYMYCMCLSSIFTFVFFAVYII